MLFWLGFAGILTVAGWGLWVDFQVRRDFEALQWALLRGSRSGRSALQFARDWAGQHAANT